MCLHKVLKIRYPSSLGTFSPQVPQILSKSTQRNKANLWYCFAALNDKCNKKDVNANIPSLIISDKQPWYETKNYEYNDNIMTTNVKQKKIMWAFVSACIHSLALMSYNTVMWFFQSTYRPHSDLYIIILNTYKLN